MQHVESTFESAKESEVEHLVAALCDRLAVLDPGAYDGQRAAALAERLARAENTCAVTKVRLAARASECGVHRDRGYVDSHDWVAAMSGTTAGAARDALQTVARLDECPETADAVAAGQVSMAQAGEIVRAEHEAPGSEHELVEVAKTKSLGAVRERARTRRLEAIDREELRTRQHSAREVRHWTDELGMVAGTFRLEPVAGTRFVKRFEREADRRWRAAKRNGNHESREALAADAFVDLAGAEVSRSPAESDGAGTSGTKRARHRRRAVNADVVIVQSAQALRRGHVRPGEVCRVVGGGPVAPSEVEELIAAGAFVKAVLHDGTQVTHVAHYGRNLTAQQRTALGLGPPPAFDGLRCTEDGCERRLGLEIDHLDPVANGGPTSLEHLDPKCWVHHQEKTKRDRAAGLFEQGP